MSDLMKIITAINVIARLVAISLLCLFVLPIQLREAQIGDGIGKVRKALLGIGFGIVLSFSVVTLVQLCRLNVECGQSLIIDYLSLFNSLGIILTALGFILVYRYKKPVDKHHNKRS